MDLHNTSARFQTTRWSLLDALRDSAPSAARERAATEMIHCYWPPVYASLRRRGLDRDRAAELTQAFFLEVVMERNLFGKADPEQAGLRALLRRALQNFVIDIHRRESKGPSQVAISSLDLETEDLMIEASGELTPDEMFERRWALELLERALRIAESQFEGEASATRWKAFQRWVLDPAIQGTSRPSQVELAEELGFRNAATLGATVQAVKLRVRNILQQLVDEVTPDPEQADMEMKRALAALG